MYYYIWLYKNLNLVYGAFLKLFLVSDWLLLSSYTFVAISMLVQRSINIIKTLTLKTPWEWNLKNLGFWFKSLNDLLWCQEPTSSLTQVCKFLWIDEIPLLLLPLLGLFFVVLEHVPQLIFFPFYYFISQHFYT